MDRSNDRQNEKKRRKAPSSAAQKILISFCGLMLFLLVGILIFAIVVEKDTKITAGPIDSLSTTQTHALTTSARNTITLTTSTVSETFLQENITTNLETTIDAVISSTTTTSETTSSQTTVLTTKKQVVKEYTALFEIQLPQVYNGIYTIEMVYSFKGKVITISNIKIPEVSFVEQELTSLTADDDVSAEIYLINETNSLRALIGSAKIDFAHSSVEYGMLDITGAFEAVQ